jgi:hypothetical protein
LTDPNTVYLIINKNNKIKVMSSKNTNTETIKRGRPVVEGSKRQAVLAMRAAKVAAGGEIKRGRPAGTKKTTDITVEVKPKLSKAQRQQKKVVAVATMEDFMANVTDGNEA